MSGMFGDSGGDTSGAQQQQAEQSRKQALIAQINGLFDAPDARAAYDTQATGVGDALRSNYTSDLKDKYDIANRDLTFSAARAGQIGSTVQADKKALLDRQNELGSTRVNDAVTQALTQLAGSREGQRNNAINLVNAGSGSDAVNAAQTGLQNSITAAQSAPKQALFGDLFQNAALNQVAGNQNAQNSALAAYLGYKSGGLPPLNPVSGSGGARVINY